MLLWKNLGDLATLLTFPHSSRSPANEQPLPLLAPPNLAMNSLVGHTPLPSLFSTRLVSLIYTTSLDWQFFSLLPPLEILGEGTGTPLQYSCLENPMDGGAWWAAVHGVVKSQTWLSDFTFTFHFHALEKEMATHSSVLAWRIPGTGEPGGLPSMGSHRVGHDWSDLAAALYS